MNTNKNSELWQRLTIAVADALKGNEMVRLLYNDKYSNIFCEVALDRNRVHYSSFGDHFYLYPARGEIYRWQDGRTNLDDIEHFPGDLEMMVKRVEEFNAGNREYVAETTPKEC